ncbi:hypothetical protein Droror1_Dr00002331, partial [Drosera rotundifolia]
MSCWHLEFTVVVVVANREDYGLFCGDWNFGFEELQVSFLIRSSFPCFLRIERGVGEIGFARTISNPFPQDWEWDCTKFIGSGCCTWKLSSVAWFGFCPEHVNRFFAEQEEALYPDSHSSSGSNSYSDNDDEEEEEEEEGDDGDGEVEIIGSSSSIADRVREEKKEEERMRRASEATTASGSVSGKGKENESEGEWDREGVEGLFCPICMEAWSNEGAHNPSVLNAKKKCTLKDVRRMYGSRVVMIDEQSNK